MQDVADALQQHAAAVTAQPADSPFEPHELLPTAASLLRALRVRR
jgi:hypothetical protein